MRTMWSICGHVIVSGGGGGGGGRGAASLANPPGVRKVCLAESPGRVYARRVAVANWQSDRRALWL